MLQSVHLTILLQHTYILNNVLHDTAGEVQSKRAEGVTLSLDWRPANAPLTRVCEAGQRPSVSLAYLCMPCLMPYHSLLLVRAHSPSISAIQENVKWAIHILCSRDDVGACGAQNGARLQRRSRDRPARWMCHRRARRQHRLPSLTVW
jgi:hypothetical protein